MVAAAADAVHPLGQVHRLEIGRERAHQVGRFGQPGVGQRIGQLGDGRVGLASGNGGTAQALDTFEETVTTLLGEDLPHERSEDFHVFAQQRVGRCEVQLLAQCGRGGRIGGRSHARQPTTHGVDTAARRSTPLPPGNQ